MDSGQWVELGLAETEKIGGEEEGKREQQEEGSQQEKKRNTNKKTDDAKNPHSSTSFPLTRVVSVE